MVQDQFGANSPDVFGYAIVWNLLYGWLQTKKLYEK